MRKGKVTTPTLDGSGPELRAGVLEPEQFSRGNRRRLSVPGLRTFIAICERWGLNELEQRHILGSPSTSVYRRWSRAVLSADDLTLTVAALMRISAVLGIHAALATLYRDKKEEIAWLRGENRAAVFGGQPPLELMVGGSLDGLLTVRRFLDAFVFGGSTEPNQADHDFQPYKDTDIVMS